MQVRTAEHVGISYRLAGLGNRVLAAFLDLVVLGIVVFGIFLVSVVTLPRLNLDGVTASIAGALLVVFVFLVLPLAYWVLLETFWNGQTLGKRVVGIRVIRDDGSPVGFFPVLARALLRLLDLIPIVFPIDVVFMVMTRNGQRLGDIVAGTVVVKATLERDFTALRTRAGSGTSRMTVRGLSGEEQRLVREFALREATLAEPVRRSVAATIARRVRPAVPEASERPDDVEFLHEVAASLREAGGEASHPG